MKKKKWFAYEIKETFNNWLWCLPFTRIKDNVRPLSIKEKDLHDVMCARTKGLKGSRSKAKSYCKDISSIWDAFWFDLRTLATLHNWTKGMKIITR